MPANIPEVVRATAPQRNGFGVFKFLNINFIKSRITVIFYPEYSRAKKIIILYQFCKTNSMYFFPSADHLICSMGVNIFDKVRQSQRMYDFRYAKYEVLHSGFQKRLIGKCKRM